MSESQTSTYSLHKITHDDGFDFSPNEFSRLKFGDDNVAYRFGVAVAEGFIRDRLHAFPVLEIVVGVSYQFIPTAALALRKHFIFHLNQWLARNGWPPAREIKIHRITTYQVDYGTLSVESRRELIGKDHFHIDRNLMGCKTILVLDDIRVTGAHEQRLLQMFDEFGLRSQVTFIYFAELANRDVDPSIENRLNFYAVHSIFDLEEIVKSGKFAINARVVKYILSSSHEAFSVFLQRQEDGFSNLLFDMAKGNGYHNVKKYSANFDTLMRRVSLGKRNFVSGEIKKIGDKAVVTELQKCENRA
jgi:hypothetical protein